MDSPFFKNRSPYQQPDPTRRPKVVQIPVHFMNSKPVDRSGSALKIQKVLRGFLVRKSMKKIKDVNIQVVEIEKKLMIGEVVESIRRNDKERLKMVEGLMSLVLKLDSIRCADLGVRVCRKDVIRQAIALQDRVDAVASIDMENESDSIEKMEESNVNMVILDDTNNEILDVGVDIGTNCGKKGANVNDSYNQSDSHEKKEDCGGNLEILNDSYGKFGGVEESNGENEIIDVGVDTEMNCTKKKGDNDNRRNGELLEKMEEDNEKMINMMTQLFERNEKQMKMLSSLTHRVELLEKVFLCDKLRNKKKNKKKKHYATAASCGEA